jgi:hypothetical protein
VALRMKVSRRQSAWKGQRNQEIRFFSRSVIGRSLSFAAPKRNGRAISVAARGLGEA